MIKLVYVFSMMGLLFLTGCASSAYKARLDNREKQANAAGLYCEWIDGGKHSDIDVEINLQMAKRCDSSKPFSLVPYKDASDSNGIMYCCAMAGESRGQSSKRRSSGPASKAPTDASGSPAASTPAAPAAGGDDIVEDK